MSQPLGYKDSGQDFFNQVIRDVSVKQKVYLIDLDRLMPENRSQYFFQDKMHFSDKGSLWVATVIAKKLSEIINTDKARPASVPGK